MRWEPSAQDAAQDARSEHRLHVHTLYAGQRRAWRIRPLCASGDHSGPALDIATFNDKLMCKRVSRGSDISGVARLVKQIN